jgi:P-type conjugative transfer protein TrbJ
MKRFVIVFILALLLHAAPARALTMACVNCSNLVTQLLEQITSVDQLATLNSQLLEDITQTIQQIEMVRQNVEQYANMLQNTAQLPSNLVNELRGNFTRLANLSSTLRTQRGDMVALGQVFMNLFPEQSLFGNLAGASPAQVEQANVRYEAEWDKWAANVDQATQATFQLSGQQLADLQQDPERFQSYMDNLLSTPDGQQKALMAGNQLTALQVQEARQLRELVATQAQSAMASQMKTEKESQMQQELWRDASKTGNLGGLRSKSDPF